MVNGIPFWNQIRNLVKRQKTFKKFKLKKKNIIFLVKLTDKK